MRDSGSRRRLTLLTGQPEDGDEQGPGGPEDSGLADVQVLQLRLMRLFGITSHTAIYYVSAAYPERFTIDPTQA